MASEASASPVKSGKAPTATPADRPLVWVDGEITPRAQAKISVFDKCVLFGDGVFEGIRAYGGRVFKMRSHLDRLAQSAAAIRLQLPYSTEEFSQIIRDTLDANGFTDAYIRLVVTRGPGSLGLDIHVAHEPSAFCIVDHLHLFDEERYRKGIEASVVARPRIPIACLDPRTKTCNYLNNVLAKAEARDVGADEAILLTMNGNVAECAGENIFIVNDGAITTPSTSAGILEGITRAFIIDLCAKEGLTCSERLFGPEEVREADEVFLTGTGAKIVAVTRVDGAPIGTGAEGPIANRLRTRFHEIVSDNAPED